MDMSAVCWTGRTRRFIAWYVPVCIRRIGLAIVEMTKEISAKCDGIRLAAAHGVGRAAQNLSAGLMGFAALNPSYALCYYALCQLEPFDQFRKMAPDHRHVF